MNPRKNDRTAVNKRFRSQRSAFTLIELLTVISIIGVLSSMVLFALFSVAENARKQRTKAQIAKIHELISGRWESYRTRPMPIKIPPRTNPRTAARLRLKALQELMRLEMPDRIKDVTAPPIEKDLLGKLIWEKGSSLSRAHNSRLTAACLKKNSFQSAECLYMILASIQDGDTNGLDFFREREKGDVDGDGMPEILDGWGQPIAFLRWAPAYLGDNFSTLQFGDFAKGVDGDAGEANGGPFDPLKVNPRWSDGVPDNDPFALFPLIYSMGPDGYGGVNQSGNKVDINDPYDTGAPPHGPHGEIDDPNEAVDNITNHMLEAR